MCVCMDLTMLICVHVYGLTDCPRLTTACVCVGVPIFDCVHLCVHV